MFLQAFLNSNCTYNFQMYTRTIKFWFWFWFYCLWWLYRNIHVLFKFWYRSTILVSTCSLSTASSQPVKVEIGTFMALSPTPWNKPLAGATPQSPCSATGALLPSWSGAGLSRGCLTSRDWNGHAHCQLWPWP